MDLCKVESNCDLIRKEFPSDEIKKTKISLTPADMTSSEPALGHSSLGLQWDLESDLLYIKTEMRGAKRYAHYHLAHSNRCDDGKRNIT